ncbi:MULTISPECIES: metallophosphoesterase [unclassified Methylobacterium]|uniref:metallophosphoesterase n=1 Tax=unclassified Methylobacterium TaxID=2615210 RepID=UPI0006FD151C|nr:MULTISPECIES: metallophosphoesterase [unclassified Methylobacterium]KQO74859.1 metallophosphoesterase [Methylobacterium sp. Leaf89]KQO78336.1 metallophosphoesterase [Methylobacterium sp. Leaf88]KQP74572.1 metallophosphoesterase [Methylobacterium sp. Leaf111]KQT70440.1 metallophosphoesterase [Methylobacterium sp. Leaf465]KQU19082.1 metallophosphoesterase [Methylobacterium sp. Leaf94]
MRLFPISDLHLERRRLDVIPRPTRPFDVLVCPGDLHEGRPESGLAALMTLAQGRPIVLVPGNHEHYAPTGDRRTAPELLAALETEVLRLNGEGADIHLLQRGAAIVLDGVRFVGTTLWSDWSLAGLWLDESGADAPSDPVAYAAARMTDPVTGSREYRGSIRNGDGTAWSPADAMAAHERERALLAAALAQPHAGPTVCVTHHPASPRAAEAFRHVPGVPWWVPAFYATTALEDLPEADRPDLWVSGHFHAGHDLWIGRTRWVANPVEGRDFSADHILTID